MSKARYHRDNVAVVIPALNEELRIREVVQSALAQVGTVIVIDDGSSDGTVAALAGLPITLLRHASRQGKGASLRDGFIHARTLGMAGVVTMDGDGQHQGEDIPRLIAAANRNPNCLINAARLQRRDQQPLYRRIGNDFGDWGISWACGFGIRDTQSGQRFYPAKALELTDVPGQDFVYEAQLLISSARTLGYRVVSVPIEARYHSVKGAQPFRRSHFRPLRDLTRITTHVIRQVWAYGNLLREYRRARVNPPQIDDAGGRFHSLTKPVSV